MSQSRRLEGLPDDRATTRLDPNGKDRMKDPERKSRSSSKLGRIWQQACSTAGAARSNVHGQIKRLEGCEGEERPS